MQPIDFNGLDTTVHGPLRLASISTAPHSPITFSAVFCNSPLHSLPTE
jgi:hypothetical protein